MNKKTKEEYNDKCTPYTCPFCTEQTFPPQSWGLSPTGWQEARERHEKYHCNKCKCCGNYEERN